MADFSDSQIGKRVVAQSGNVVGEVTEVRNGSLYVTVGPDADSEVTDHLNWGGVVVQETHKLNDRFVSNVTDDTVRLRV